MAGYLYLGKKKVCPAILMGGGGEQAVMPLFELVDGELAWKSVIVANGVISLTKTPFYYTSTESIFRGRSEIEEIYFPDTEVVSESFGTYFLSQLPNLRVVSFEKLREIEDNGLYSGCTRCPNLSTIDFSSLETVGEMGLGECFYNSGLSGVVSFPKLKSAGFGAFVMSFNGNVNTITRVNFKMLDDVGESAFYQCFKNNTSLQDIYFNSLKSTSFATTDVFEDMLYRVTGCTVHFPSNLQSVIGGWSDVVGGFGGTNTTVLFDLPATE